MIRFGSFQIDPRTWLLTQQGQPVDLSPRLVEILGYIVARDGEIVTKDELLERFWPDVHVSENTLTRAIADIRKAIKDEAAEPKTCKQPRGGDIGLWGDRVRRVHKVHRVRIRSKSG
jgi:DNA-binding winged helix-turn-helix (wHTH) protein